MQMGTPDPDVPTEDIFEVIQGPGFDVNENLMASAEGIPFDVGRIFRMLMGNRSRLNLQTLMILLDQEFHRFVRRSDFFGAPRWHSEYCLMAKITQALTRASREYDQKTFQSLVRDLDGVINKLNTTFQQDLRQEIEAMSFFIE